MSFTSDNINLLTNTIPINAGQTWISEKVIAGQYASITISIKTDQDGIFTMYFSGDGTNFDIQKQFNISANVPVYESLVILAKWMRVSFQNTSLVNQTFFRFFSYGSVQNSNVNVSNILNDILNEMNDLQIKNFPVNQYNQLNTTHLLPVQNMNFTFANQAPTSETALSFQYPKFAYDFDVGTTDATKSIYRFQNGLFKMLGNNSIDANFCFCIQSRACFPYVANQSYICRFDCIFPRLSLNNNSSYKVGMGYKTNLNISFIDYGIFIGAHDSYDNLAIFFYENGGSPIIINRNDWDDPLFGGTTGFFLDEVKLNSYAIEYTSSCVYFQAYNYLTKEYYTFHTLILTGTSTLIQPKNNYFHFIAQQEKTHGQDQTDLNYGPLISNFSSYISGVDKIYHSLPLSYSFFGVCSTETLMFALRSNITYNLNIPTIPLYIYSMHFATESNNIAVFRIYKDSTFDGVVTWQYIEEDYSPAQYLTSNNIADPGVLIYTCVVGPKGVSDVVFDDNAFLCMDPGTIYAVTANTPTTDARHYCSFNFKHGC